MEDPTYDLKCELAVALAERDQADTRVVEQDAELDELRDHVATLEKKLAEWMELEAYRQAHWETLKADLEALRRENSELRKRDSEPAAKNPSQS